MKEIELKLQALLDGELPESEARQVTALMECDANARAVFTELQQTSLALKGNEPERRLPESHEFFWSKIEREITQLEKAPVSETPWWIAFVRRYMPAISGVGVATALVLIGAFQLNWVSPDLLEEIDNPLEDTSSFSFRSESQKMTVVWISDTTSAEVSAEPVDDFESEESVQ
jgi:anti-sigma factor RsiW